MSTTSEMIEDGFDVLHADHGSTTFTIGSSTVDCVQGENMSIDMLGPGGLEPIGDLVLYIKASDFVPSIMAKGKLITYDGGTYRILVIRKVQGLVSLDLKDESKK